MAQKYMKGSDRPSNGLRNGLQKQTVKTGASRVIWALLFVFWCGFLRTKDAPRYSDSWLL